MNYREIGVVPTRATYIVRLRDSKDKQETIDHIEAMYKDRGGAVDVVVQLNSGPKRLVELLRHLDAGNFNEDVILSFDAGGADFRDVIPTYNNI